MSHSASTTTLATRPLGKTGVEVTTIGIGCGSLGRAADGSINPDTAVATLVAALDSGVRLIDTASVYLDGAAERFVGQALRERPELAARVVVESKVRDVREFGYSVASQRSCGIGIRRCP